jgi:hypothetical protein
MTYTRTPAADGVVSCDFPGCPEQHRATPWQDEDPAVFVPSVFDSAQGRGWLITPGRDLCPYHAQAHLADRARGPVGSAHPVPTPADVAADPGPYPDDDQPRCLEEYQGGCAGPVEYRHALSSTGHSFPRCDHHWSLRLDTQARIRRRYPDSPIPPAGFDPSYAGETWDDEG